MSFKYTHFRILLLRQPLRMRVLIGWIFLVYCCCHFAVKFIWKWVSLHSFSLMLSLDDRPGYTINANIAALQWKPANLWWFEKMLRMNDGIPWTATWKLHSMWWKVLISRCRCQLLFAYECKLLYEEWHNLYVPTVGPYQNSHRFTNSETVFFFLLCFSLQLLFC